jgi:hypothetical protein
VPPSSSLTPSSARRRPIALFDSNSIGNSCSAAAIDCQRWGALSICVRPLHIDTIVFCRAMIGILVAAFLSVAAVTGVIREVIVGDNVRMSRDETPYGEPYIARHPTRAKRLVGIASKFVANGRLVPVVFVSADGGGTWLEKPLPAGDVAHAVDSWITFSNTGVAYASVLIIATGGRKTRIAVFRSDDAGDSWTCASTITAEGSFDRPSLIARGKDVVVAAEYRGGITLLHSRDGGRTFGLPRLFRPAENIEHNAMNPLWRGASVIVPYVDYGQTLTGSRLGVVRSSDFGRTWSTPAVVADVPRRFPGLAEFAAADDSLYAAFASGSVETRTVSVVSSRDGAKWGFPTQVSNAGAQAFRPAIAVTSGGEVGVTWLEAQSGCTRLWFCVSTDRGRTFSKPVPVSDQYSCGNTVANRSAFERWEHGGDYFGLAADDDSFVATWADARSGTFQIYAARIRLAAAVLPSPQ